MANYQPETLHTQLGIAYRLSAVSPVVLHWTPALDLTHMTLTLGEEGGLGPVQGDAFPSLGAVT